MKKFCIIISLFILLPIKCFAAGTVEINTASLQQLETLSGIGPVKAQAIISSRPFSSVDDLLRVKGIGPKTLQEIKDQGLAYIEGQTQQTAQSATNASTTTTASTTATNEQVATLPAIVYPDGVFINEILPNPKGPDGTDEWMVSTIQLTGMANLAYL